MNTRFTSVTPHNFPKLAAYPTAGPPTEQEYLLEQFFKITNIPASEWNRLKNEPYLKGTWSNGNAILYFNRGDHVDLTMQYEDGRVLTLSTGKSLKDCILEFSGSAPDGSKAFHYQRFDCNPADLDPIKEFDNGKQNEALQNNKDIAKE